MTRRCWPGCRARFLPGELNEGRIVVVVRHHFGEKLGGVEWIANGAFPWVVTSLSGPLQSRYIDTGMPAPPATTIVCDDSALEPLLDDDDGATTDQGADKSVQRDLASLHDC